MAAEVPRTEHPRYVGSKTLRILELVHGPACVAKNRTLAQQLVGLFLREVLEDTRTDWPHYVLRDISDIDEIGGLYLLPGDMDLPLLEREVAVTNKFSAMRASARALLASAANYVDVVLVDCAPGISVMTETWLRECDFHLIPVKPDFLAVSGLEYVRRFRSRNPEMGFAAHLGIVINMLEPMSEGDRVMMEHLHADKDLKCFETPIPLSNQMQRAALLSAAGCGGGGDAHARGAAHHAAR